MANYKMSYKSITLENYKNIKNAHLDLKPINILVGSNNSGKSNFLNYPKVLNNLFSGGSDKTLFENSFGGGFNEKPPLHKFILAYEVFALEEPEVIFDCEYSLVIQPRYWMSGNEGQIQIEPTVIIEELYEYKQSTKTGPPIKFVGRETGKFKLSKGISNNIKTEEIKSSVTISELFNTVVSGLDELHLSILNGPIEFSKISSLSAHEVGVEVTSSNIRDIYNFRASSREKSEIFEETFCKMLDFSSIEIERIETKTSKKRNVQLTLEMGDVEDSAVYWAWAVRNGKYYHLQDLSDGSKLMLKLLYKLFNNEDSLVLIDEPEIGLHPKALKIFFESIADYISDKKVIIATHSTYLLKLIDWRLITISELDGDGKNYFKNAKDIPNLAERLKSKYVNFGDLLAENFKDDFDADIE